MENQRVQMNDVSADTKSAVARGAAVRDLRGAFQGASAGGAAKVQQRCSKGAAVGSCVVMAVHRCATTCTQWKVQDMEGSARI